MSTPSNREEAALEAYSRGFEDGLRRAAITCRDEAKRNGTAPTFAKKLFTQDELRALVAGAEACALVIEDLIEDL